MGSSVLVINSAVVFGVNIMRTLLVLSALLALASCAPASSDDPTGKVLKYVITTTGTGSHCGMDTGHITLTLTSPIDEECKTNYLNSPANDFEQGETNIFTGECLGSCRSMAFPDGLFHYVVTHTGGDGWCARSTICWTVSSPTRAISMTANSSTYP